MSSDLPEDIQSYHDEPCPRCKGAGKNPKDSKLGYPENACYYCDGTGKRPIITVELSESAPKAPSVQNSESDSGDDWLDATIQQMLVDYTNWTKGVPIAWNVKKAVAKAAIQAQLKQTYADGLAQGMKGVYQDAASQVDAAYQRGHKQGRYELLPYTFPSHAKAIEEAKKGLYTQAQVDEVVREAYKEVLDAAEKIIGWGAVRGRKPTIEKHTNLLRHKQQVKLQDLRAKLTTNPKPCEMCVAGVCSKHQSKAKETK